MVAATKGAPSAWYCQSCGRFEHDEAACPACGQRGQRCSRFEWFLADALRAALGRTGRSFEMIEQWPMRDHRGFYWYWDLLVRIEGASPYGGYRALIEVNGSDHARQKRYAGPGGGYTRDYDKDWEAFTTLRLHKQGYEKHVLSNEQCRRSGGAVLRTAAELAAMIVERADTWL